MEQFSMLLTQDHARTLRKFVGAGQPLRFVFGGHNRQSDFSQVQPGDGVWLLTFAAGRVFLLAHIVASERVPHAKYLHEHPEDAPLARSSCGIALLAQSSTPLRFGRAIPCDVVQRMRFKIGSRGQRTRELKNFEGGRLKNAHSLAGVFRLAEDSVQDLREMLELEAAR